MLQPANFFDLDDPLTAAFFAECNYVWEAIGRIGSMVEKLVGQEQLIRGDIADGAYLSDRPLFIGEGAVIEPGAYVQGPAYIAPGAIVRHGAYVREWVVMLPNSVLGHASEAKNALLLSHAAAPHFNYVGDSILGNYVNLGAGTKLSNLGMMNEKDAKTGKRPSIVLTIDGERYDTGLTKLGAILGDHAQTGCNAVLNPGCLVGRETLVYANTSLRKGYHDAGSIVKLRQNVRRIERLS